MADAAGSRAILAVALEPAGGSPTGAPTGPVVATGALGTLQAVALARRGQPALAARR
jgi:hypothetical protein